MKEIKRFDCDVYPISLWLACGVSYDKLNKYFKTKFPEFSNADATTYKLSAVSSVDRDGVLIFFNNEKCLTHGVIAHESVHFASYIFDFIQAKMDIENDETYAYLVGWCAEKCSTLIKKDKKKV